MWQVMKGENAWLDSRRLVFWVIKPWGSFLFVLHTAVCHTFREINHLDFAEVLVFNIMFMDTLPYSQVPLVKWRWSQESCFGPPRIKNLLCCLESGKKKPFLILLWTTITDLFHCPDSGSIYGTCWQYCRSLFTEGMFMSQALTYDWFSTSQS